MTEWEPIKLEELNNLIHKDESELTGEAWNFWQLIKIKPKKWKEQEFGELGGGFWAVGICGKNVVWYNDIEDGFNVSNYDNYGEIKEYYANQDELSWCINKLFNLVKSGEKTILRKGPPKKLE